MATHKFNERNGAITAKFLEHFGGMQLFMHMPDGRKGRVKHIQEDIYECCNTMQHFNDNRGHGIWFTVNELDQELVKGKERTAGMCIGFRALFMDDDNVREAHRTDFALEPNLVVETSEGKFHYYWLITEDSGKKIRQSDWESVEKSLVDHYGGDPGVRDVPRVMRLPGFYHCKDLDNRSLVNFISLAEEKYEWKELREKFGSLEAIESKERTEGNGGKGRTERGGLESKTVAGYVSEIKNGINLHDNINSLSYQYVKEGVQRAYIIELIQGFMDSVDNKDDRWQERYDDIGRSVSGAFERAARDKVNVHDIKDARIYDAKEMPWPPGLFGQLVSNAYDMAMYQYREVAFVSAIGLVAGITGRKFNVSNTGLNLYMTLIMNTGMGKDSIGKFINKCLNMACSGNLSSGNGFDGPKRFTGPKAVINALEGSRSMVSVFTEAGILMRSSAGDQDGLTRCLLGIYTQSGEMDWTGSEEFSSVEGRIDSLNSPALSIINEATPETLITALSDSGSLENGHLPRQSIFRVDVKKPYSNKEILNEPDRDVKLRLIELAKLCMPLQIGNLPKGIEHVGWHMDVGTSAIDFQDECVDYENFAERSGDNIKKIMASRMWLKAAKMAALCAVFNYRKDEARGEAILIDKASWEWAKELCLWEYEGTNKFFSSSNFNNILEDLAKTVVGPVIVKYLKAPDAGGYKANVLTKRDRNNGHLSYSAINQKTRNNRRLAYDRLHTDNAKGLKSVLSYMVDAGYLNIIYRKGDDANENPRGERNMKSNMYSITNMFVQFMGELGDG